MNVGELQNYVACGGFIMLISSISLFIVISRLESINKRLIEQNKRKAIKSSEL